MPGTAPRWRLLVMHTWWCLGCQFGTGSCMLARWPECRSLCWTLSRTSGFDTEPSSSSAFASAFTAVCVYVCERACVSLCARVCVRVWYHILIQTNCVFRSGVCRSGRAEDASVLSVWRHSQHSIPHGVQWRG